MGGQDQRALDIISHATNEHWILNTKERRKRGKSDNNTPYMSISSFVSLKL